MTYEEGLNYKWDIFDPTKEWTDIPLTEIGEIELNEIPSDNNEINEKAAFAPDCLVPGIEASIDKIL